MLFMLRFVQITDTHVGSTPDFELYRRNTYQETQRLVNFLNNDLPFEPDFIVHTGDVTNFRDANSAQLAASLLRELRYPVYYVAGNHDSQAMIRQYLLGASEPDDSHLCYDFRMQDCHFIVLDTIGNPDPQGYVSSNQLEWLAQTCADSSASSLCIFLHHLPVRMGVPWYDRDMRIMNDEALFSVLKPYRERLRGIFFGHIHRAFTGFRDGILCSASASAFAQINTWPTDEEASFDYDALGGYALVTLDNEQVTVTHHTLPREETDSRGR
jgi:3',5'-cyclic-AMP phosphodiesterase